MIQRKKSLSRRGGIRGILAVVVGLLLLVVSIPATVYFLTDRQNEPLCHKLALIQFQNWLDREKTDALPNINGESAESINKLNHDFEKEEINQWNSRYQYVPGLRRGDPGDLVLMYMKQPTRYIWHSNPQSIFAEARWMVVPLDFCGGGIGRGMLDRQIPYRGENSERLSLEEFKNRLRKTLKFLQDDNRPHWQTVVAENEALLASLEAQ
jgi:hypothetical protein